MAPHLQQFQYAPLAEPPVIPPDPGALGFRAVTPVRVPTRARGLDAAQHLAWTGTFRKAITGEERGLEQAGPQLRHRDWYQRPGLSRLQITDPFVPVVAPPTVPELSVSVYPSTTRAPGAAIAHQAVGALTFKSAILGEEFGVVRERGPHWDARDRYQRVLLRLLGHTETMWPPQTPAPPPFETGASTVYVDRTRRLALATAHQRAGLLGEIVIPPTTQITPGFAHTLVVFSYQVQYQPYTFAPLHQVATTITGVFSPQVDDVRAGRGRPRVGQFLPQAPIDTVVANIPVPGTAQVIPIATVGGSELAALLSSYFAGVASEAFPSVPFGWVPAVPVRVPLAARQTRIDGLTFTNAGLVVPPNAWMGLFPDTTRRDGLLTASQLASVRGEALEQFAATLLWYPQTPDRVPTLAGRSPMPSAFFAERDMATVAAPDGSWLPWVPEATWRARLPVALYPAIARAESLESLASTFDWVGSAPMAVAGRTVLRALVPDTDADHGYPAEVIPTPTGFWPVAPARIVRPALAEAQQRAHVGGPSPEQLPTPLAWLPVGIDRTTRAPWPPGLESVVKSQPLEQFEPTLLWLILGPDRTVRAVLPIALYPSFGNIETTILLSVADGRVHLVPRTGRFLIVPPTDRDLETEG